MQIFSFFSKIVKNSLFWKVSGVGSSGIVDSHPCSFFWWGQRLWPECRPAGVFWADKIIFVARKSTRRGLLGRQNQICCQKVDPQGPFEQKNSYLLPESRPAVAFWADTIVSFETFWPDKIPQTALALEGFLLGLYRIGYEFQDFGKE